MGGHERARFAVAPRRLSDELRLGGLGADEDFGLVILSDDLLELRNLEVARGVGLVGEEQLSPLLREMGQVHAINLNYSIWRRLKNDHLIR